MPKRGGNIAVYEEEIRDDDEHYFPGIDDEEAIRADGDRFLLVKLVSTLDADVDVNLCGTTFDDPDFDEEAVDAVTDLDDVTGVTGDKDVTFVQSHRIWKYFRIKVKANSTPTEGKLKVVFAVGL